MTSKWNIYNSRVGIMGEGYGGYVSIYGLTDQQSNIRCGVGFRPIVDWKVYCKYSMDCLIAYKVLFL